jgi:hypothetical protein
MTMCEWLSGWVSDEGNVACVDPISHYKTQKAMRWDKREIAHWHEFEWTAPGELALRVRVDEENAECTGHESSWYKALILSKFPTLYDMMCEYIRQAQRHGAPIHVWNQMWLERLPDMPTARVLDCGFCRGLTSLPDAPDLVELICDRTWLTESSGFTSLQSLHCRSCLKLERIGDMPNLKHLVCCNCASLVSVGQMPRLEYVDSYGCPKLKEGPKVKPT